MDNAGVRCLLKSFRTLFTISCIVDMELLVQFVPARLMSLPNQMSCEFGFTVNLPRMSLS